MCLVEISPQFKIYCICISIISIGKEISHYIISDEKIYRNWIENNAPILDCNDNVSISAWRLNENLSKQCKTIYTLYNWDRNAGLVTSNEVFFECDLKKILGLAIETFWQYQNNQAVYLFN